jgi:hypothetical protein
VVAAPSAVVLTSPAHSDDWAFTVVAVVVAVAVAVEVAVSAATVVVAAAAAAAVAAMSMVHVKSGLGQCRSRWAGGVRKRGNGVDGESRTRVEG